MANKIVVKTPGKLMVAGEFAVLEKGYPLIVMAVDRYVYTTLEDHEYYAFTSENFNLHDYKWHFNGSHVVFDKFSPRLKFVTTALTTALIYLRERGISTTPFNMTVRSELDDEKTGAKYGLGSSAAVVTSVITAILEKFLTYPPSRSLIFKLAAIAHVRTQGSGSGADIAASTYGGLLYYQSFQANWLKGEMEKNEGIIPLIQKKWIYLRIQQIKLPDSIDVYIGWTGKPASTKNLVYEISKLKRSNWKAYNQFLTDSKEAVRIIVDGIRNDDFNKFVKGIKSNRHALATLGEIAQVPIETEKLAVLSDSAEQLDGAGKLSGAGGGDCGLAFLRSSENRQKLYKQWERHGIKPLSLSIENHGTTTIYDE